jgi:hypothetical protein
VSKYFFSTRFFSACFFSSCFFSARGFFSGGFLLDWLRAVLALRRQPPLAGQRPERPADRERRRRAHHGPAPEHALGQQPAHVQRGDPQGRRALPLVHAGPVHPHHIRAGGDVVPEGTQDPLRGLRDVTQHGECRPARREAFCIIRSFLAEGPHLCGTRSGGGAQRGQRRRQRLGQHVEPAGTDIGQHPGEPFDGLAQPVEHLPGGAGTSGEDLGGAADGGLGAGRGQLP